MKTNKLSSQYLLAVAGIVLGLVSQCSERKNPVVINWIYDMDQALSLAARSQKPLMIDFMATWCPPCKAMEKSTFADSAIIAKSQNFITVRIDVDKKPEIANKYNGNARKYGGVGIPNLLFLTADQDTLRHIIGFHDPNELSAVMDSVLTIFISITGKN